MAKIKIASWIMRSSLIRACLDHSPQIKNLVLCITDHYEPGVIDRRQATQRRRVALLQEKYPAFAQVHRDDTGNPLQWTWFFPPQFHYYGNLSNLVKISRLGVGEIEMHLHHGENSPDTSEHLELALKKIVEEYRLQGIFGSIVGKPAYAFIHGMWGLNNSTPAICCGVNNELELLQRSGCYADMTFPCIGNATPKTMNQHVYADVRRAYSKSYEKNRPAAVGKPPAPYEFLLMQGPIVLMPSWTGGRLRLSQGIPSLTDDQPLLPKRADAFIKTHIHIKGCPDTTFIKFHTHSAPAVENFFGQEMHDFFTYIESLCKKRGIRLFYTSAREFYNIFKAIEAGKNSAEIANYRNFIVAPPQYIDTDIQRCTPEFEELVVRPYLTPEDFIAHTQS